MFKRMILALTFLAAFTVAGIVPTKTADAWRYGGRPYVARYYYAPRAFYRDSIPYRTYYRPYYAPRVYDPYYNAYYGYPDYYGPRSGVFVSVGF